MVLTLDAGGTNFVFSAMRGAREVIAPLTVAARGDDLAVCLGNLRDGFRRVSEQAGAAPQALSIAFPGPADYAAGIIWNTHNLPAFSEGVAIGPMLEDCFGLPVFLNNDGGLFAYGEAIGGFLPYLNRLLEEAGRRRRFRTLFGATLGTGFGGGVVCDGRLYRGDNTAAGEVWAFRHKLDPDHCVEDGISIRGVRHEYSRRAGIDPDESPDPQVIFEIAEGRCPGHRAAAREAFRRLGEVTGDALANVATLLDAPIVIGGGLSGASPLFLPALIEEMNGRFWCAGAKVARTALTAFNLEDEDDRERFLTSDECETEVPESGRRLSYDPIKRIAVGLSRLGTSQAVALGAYASALEALDSRST